MSLVTINTTELVALCGGEDQETESERSERRSAEADERRDWSQRHRLARFICSGDLKCMRNW